VRRRDFVVRLGTALVAAPFAAWAQSPDRVRRIGMLVGYAESDPDSQRRLAAFKEELAARGWKEPGNLSIDVRWTAGDVARAAPLARELVALKPELIVANTTPVTAALQRETRSIPIVFLSVADPVGSGFVQSLSRPGGNLTGLTNLEASLAEKWLQILKEIAPRVNRVAVMFNPKTAPYAEYYLQPIKAAAQGLGVETFAATVGSEADIERAIVALGRRPGSGLLIMNDSYLTVHRKPAIVLAARHKVPAMYYSALHVEDGGLIGYGVDNVDHFRRAAPFVERILQGARPQDLPVEKPTKFELAVNKKTAAALGIRIPQSILIRADKVVD